jgi:hypothetical protein
VQRSLARKLVALLVLLALIASGDRFAMVMAMEQSGTQMTDMQKPDMSCKACGAMMAAAPCDALCAALPAIDAAFIDLSDVGVRERWAAHSESGATHFISPDTSPPRTSLS